MPIIPSERQPRVSIRIIILRVWESVLPVWLNCSLWGNKYHFGNITDSNRYQPWTFLGVLSGCFVFLFVFVSSESWCVGCGWGWGLGRGGVASRDGTGDRRMSQ